MTVAASLIEGTNARISDLQMLPSSSFVLVLEIRPEFENENDNEGRG
jgi:hypothetical protein